MTTIKNSKHDGMHDLHHGAETDLICFKIITYLFYYYAHVKMIINNNKK